MTTATSRAGLPAATPAERLAERRRAFALAALVALIALATAFGTGPKASAGRRTVAPAQAQAPRQAPALAPNAGCTATGASLRLAGPGDRRVVALTFDDGPGPATPALLDALEHAGVRATFFPTANRIAENAHLLRRVLTAGGELGNHTFNHANVSRGGLGEMRRAQAAIVEATGYAPCLFRAPRNKTSALAIREARSLGLLTVQWSVDSRDWTGASAAAIHARVVAGAHPGAIILLHDEGRVPEHTLAAVPAIIASLRQRGYGFVTVPELLGLATRRAR